jgi:hypothetical protein
VREDIGREGLSFCLSMHRWRVATLSLWFVVAGTVCGNGFAEGLAGKTPIVPVTVGMFEFHSGFWINLHHFLYQQALPQDRSRQPAPEIAAGYRGGWDQAVSFYRDSMVSRDLLTDEQMVRIDSYLARMEGAATINGDVIGDELAGVLSAAAPIYRQQWWERHDATNRFWIRLAQPLVEAVGDQMRTQLAKAYGAEWPAEPIRVDVAVYANWAGAYTNTEADGQIHTIMSSENAGYQGFRALEMLFHEASHGIVDGKRGKLGEAIQSEAKKHGIDAPDDFWHALIFYTTGEFARRDLDGLGVHEFEPLADKQGLWVGGWRDYRGLLGTFWRAYLDGKISLDEALGKIMDGLAVSRRSQASHIRFADGL